MNKFIHTKKFKTTIKIKCKTMKNLLIFIVSFFITIIFTYAFDHITGTHFFINNGILILVLLFIVFGTILHFFKD